MERERNAEVIEAEIQATRAHLDDTLHALEHRLSPAQLQREARALMPSGGSRRFLSNLSQAIKQNPVPVLLTGVGLSWLIVSHLKSQRSPARFAQPGHGAQRIPAWQEAPQRMVATHLGTQQGRSRLSQHRPDVIGVATHLGTAQGWRGYVHPGL